MRKILLVICILSFPALLLDAGCVIMNSHYSDPVTNNQVKTKYWKSIYYTSLYSHQEYTIRWQNGNVSIDFSVKPITSGLFLTPFGIVVGNDPDITRVSYKINKGYILCEDLKPVIEIDGKTYELVTKAQIKFNSISLNYISHENSICNYEYDKIITGNFVLRVEVNNNLIAIPDVYYLSKESWMVFPIIWY